MKNRNGFVCKKIDYSKNLEEQRKQEFKNLKNFAPKGQIQFIRRKENKKCILTALKSLKRIPTCNLYDDYLIVAVLIEPDNDFLSELKLKGFSYCCGFKKGITKYKKAGNPQIDLHRNTDTSEARKQNIDKTNEYKSKIIQVIQEICVKHKIATNEYTAIANKLNYYNYKTRLGNYWTYKAVKRLMDKKENNE